MPSTFIQDMISVSDFTLYSIKQIAHGGKEYTFFDTTEQQVGKSFSNLTIPNQLSKNWIRFSVYGIAIKIFKVLNLDELYDFYLNSYYSFKVADHELKFGHLSEFLHTNVIITYHYGGTYLNGMGDGAYNGLITGLEIVIPSGVSFVFTIKYEGSSLDDALVGVFLKGKLERLITG
ncbi:MAG: hypothetical protein RMJ67_06060 [Elusimicrobiota bacterium]|nr:hypothetical protein [Endomicrobiia bacterium]MDW8166057.1 hypothetical protein [Elusimicrobiota bacterium]